MATLTLTNHIPEFSPLDTDSDCEDLQEEPSFANRRRGCCFWFPCFASGQCNPVWERIATTPEKEKEESSSWRWDWWDKGLNALKKVREWSELVAGPKWKTFIRRFNKGRGGIKSGAAAGGKFQYDPLSYALNFDDGPAQNGSLVDDDDKMGLSLTTMIVYSVIFRPGMRRSRRRQSPLWKWERRVTSFE